jgi:hypothetical protein
VKKRYSSGQPDLTLLCKLNNGHTDVVALEFKNPNGSNTPSIEQQRFLNKLEARNVRNMC